MVSLNDLIEWPVEYEQAPPLFCFGLLAQFDIPRLLSMCEGVAVRDPNRGLLVAGTHAARGSRS
jgi:hypothetical protein